MEDGGTKGISSTEGFKPLDQTFESQPTSSEGVPRSGDPFGFQHVPTLMQYLEDHSAFTAVVLSIIGYVVIAAFGGIKTLGQYLGYIIFLSGACFVYFVDKQKTRWLYGFMLLTVILIIGIIVQNLSKITAVYRIFNGFFGL